MGLFDSTKKTIRTVTGKLFILDDILEVGIKVAKRLNNKAHSHQFVSLKIAKAVLEKLEIDQVDDKLISYYKTIKVRTKKWYQTSKKYGYLIAGDVLVTLGESTADDDIIIAVITAACVAAVGSMSGTGGALLANVVTESTLKPILEGAFKYLDKAQITVGKKLKEKSNEI